MHAGLYLTICAASVAGVMVFGAPPSALAIVGSALAIAVLGVPHGGLDHWAGSRLLRPSLGAAWWAVFFPAYLMVGILFAMGWYLAPTLTVCTFFLLSAWHFGREDQEELGQRGLQSKKSAIVHLEAMALGGLVIWVPALTRTEELQSLLGLIVPTGDALAVRDIVFCTQAMSLVLVPLAGYVGLTRLISHPDQSDRWVPIATAGIAVCLPILCSFSLFFCAWHSWRGLQRLQREECLSTLQMWRCIAPLSVTAVAGVVVAAIWMREVATSSLLIDSMATTLQPLFIGLSALAVPHLVLHEFEGFQVRSACKQEIYA